MSQLKDIAGLPVESEISRLFNDTETWWDYGSIYRRLSGCVEEGFLRELFGTLEKNIEREVKWRMQPGYKKEVTGKSRMYVGSMTENQWVAYKLQKRQAGAPTWKERNRAQKVPSFSTRERVYECTNMIEWSSELPSLSHNSHWWVNKWRDEIGVIWRAWLISFGLVWNSFTGAIYIIFEYRCQHYSYINDSWMFN